MNLSTQKQPAPTFSASTPRQIALAAARSAQERKGESLSIIDVGGRSDYADYILIVTAYSDRQTNAIALGIQRDLLANLGIKPSVREGSDTWHLLDYDGVVIHVFHEDARAHYNLDQLWSGAPRLAIPVVDSTS